MKQFARRLSLAAFAVVLAFAAPAAAQQAICVSSARSAEGAQMKLSGVNNCGVAVHYSVCAVSGASAQQRFARTLKPGEAWSFSVPMAGGQSPKVAADYCRASPGVDPASCAVKCPSSGGSVTPQWLRRPTGEDLAKVFPVRAQRMDVSGSAAIACTILDTGLLADCRLLEETPAGYGFGEAALRLARSFKARPLDAQGNPVAGATTRIPISFQVPE